MVLVAGALAATCVFLGIRAAADTRYVIWFGLATALFAPAAFQLLALALAEPSARLLRQLSTVPQLEALIEQAESEQERVRLLEE